MAQAAPFLSNSKTLEDDDKRSDFQVQALETSGDTGVGKTQRQLRARHIQVGKVLKEPGLNGLHMFALNPK